jgi:hypothetical protein
MNEYKLLIYIFEFCEENGSLYKNFHFDINHKLVEELYKKYRLEPTIEELETIADRCYAREWLEHTYLGSGKYNGLKLTQKGMGVAISKRKVEEKKNDRTRLKKASDYIEEYKGIFILLAVLTAIAGVAVTLLVGGGKNG